MKMLWNVIDRIEIGKPEKDRLFLLLLVMINIVIGGLIWLLCGRYLFPETEWLICFMGYPAVFAGFFGGILYLYKI